MVENKNPINGRKKKQAAKSSKLENSDSKNEVSQSKNTENISKNQDQKNLKSPKQTNSINELFYNKKNLLIFCLSISLSTSAVVSLVLGLWFYNITLEQKEKINELTIMLDQMPKPISQGRLGLIIKKSNKNLETMVKEESVLLEGKILKIENLLSSFPKPVSEGKVGLILDKRIKNLKKEIEKQINQKISSFEGREQELSEENNLSPALIKQFKELELSVDKLAEIIGLVQLSKSVTEEITDLKSKIKGSLKIDFQSDKRQVVLSENLFNSEDFALISKQFSDYAYQAIKEDLKYNKKDGIINSVINKFQLIFVQRSLTPQEGNTVDAILSRAENALNLKDYKKVIDELNELPQRASEVMLNWRKSFENFVEEKR